MAYGYTRTLPTITGSHSDFPVVLTAGSFPTAAIDGGANSIDNGGGNLRAYTDDTKATQLPLDVVTFVTGGSPQVQVWVKMPTSSTGDTIYLEADDVETSQPAFTNTYGRNAVYSDDISRLHMDSATPIDSTGNQTSIVNNGATLVSGLHGNVLDFDGSDYVDLGAGILPTNDFTQSIWVNPDSLGGFQGFIGSWLSSEVGRTYLGANGTSLNWDGYSSVIARGTLVNSSWQYCTATRTGSTVVLSINGVQQGASGVDTGTSPDNTHNTFIGALQEGTNYFFNGQIGDNRLSNLFSSQDRILTEYQNQNDPGNWGTSSAWEDQAGAITITENTTNTNYASLDPAITLTGSLSITESLVNTNYTNLNPSITLTGSISIAEQVTNTNYTELNPTITLTGVIQVTENTTNTNYNPLNPAITLTGVVQITESTTNVNYDSLNPAVSLTSTAIQIEEQLVNVQYSALNPSILLTPEPLGIVSTVCFDGNIKSLSFNGVDIDLTYSGNKKELVFNGNFNELEFNGTIQVNCSNGSIKINC